MEPRHPIRATRIIFAPEHFKLVARIWPPASQVGWRFPSHQRAYTRWQVTLRRHHGEIEMSRPTKKMHKRSLWQNTRFHVRNYISERLHRWSFNTSLWFRVQARRRKAAAMDPLWKESWWCLERRYTKIVKDYCRLELRYMKVRDELRRVRQRGQTRANRFRD